MNENWKPGDGLEYEKKHFFAPTIIKSKMPLNLVDALNTWADNIKKSEEEFEKRRTIQYTNHPSFSVDAKFLQSSGVGEWLGSNAIALKKEFIEDCQRRWPAWQMEEKSLGYGKLAAEEAMKESIPNIHVAWINDYSAGDFVSWHTHHDTSISGVLFLKVPDDIYIGNGAGELVFLHGQVAQWTHNMERIRPVVGDAYFFPCWLEHSVNPHFAKGLRRSMAINILWSTNYAP